MPADLSHIERRVARAKRDLDALRKEATTYMQPPPYRAVVERDGDSEAIHTYIDKEPDPEWAITFGGIGVQARSALDHLVYQLVIDSGNPVSKRTRTQFPIFENASDYRGSRDRMLNGVATRHRRIIESFQPYKRGSRAHEDPLATLATITNRDKHREDHVAWGAVGQATYRLDRSLVHPPQDDIAITVDYNAIAPQRIRDGGLLLGLENRPDPRFPDAKVKLELDSLQTVLLFEGDRLVSLDDLERSVLHVEGIIERFARRIKP